MINEINIILDILIDMSIFSFEIAIKTGEGNMTLIFYLNMLYDAGIQETLNSLH